MALCDTQKLLFVAVLKYVVFKPPQVMYHWTTSLAKQLLFVSRSLHFAPIGRQIHCLSLGRTKVLRSRLWNAHSITSTTSCPNLHMSVPFEEHTKKKVTVTRKSPRWFESFTRNRKSWGRNYFTSFPDLTSLTKSVVVAGSEFAIGWMFYPGLTDRTSATSDPTLRYNSAVQLSDEKTPMLKFYLVFPWRALSRAWGKVHRMWTIPVYLRPYFFGLFAKVYNVNINEALNPDLKSYSNFSEFFRRPIKPSMRPVDEIAELVSPADGRVLHFGKVVNGAVEQVKGVTYSLQKFLGPLHADPLHEEWGKRDEYKRNWCTAPLKNYTKALMHNPTRNDLFHCVIYLAPGDYHRFHSPADWIVQHRRHFPGDLLSVNPMITSLIPSLFVMNERVSLLGKWHHGFFSMTAVGATNVGSVEIYGDTTLKTNRFKRIYGGYYDRAYADVPASKGVGMGEFNLGSTIVLIFEAPKDFQYVVESNQKICYGSALQKIQDLAALN